MSRTLAAAAAIAFAMFVGSGCGDRKSAAGKKDLEKTARHAVTARLTENDIPAGLRLAKCRSVEITGGVDADEDIGRDCKAVAVLENGERLNITVKYDGNIRLSADELIRFAVDEALAKNREFLPGSHSAKCRSVEGVEAIEAGAYGYESTFDQLPGRYYKAVAVTDGGERFGILAKFSFSWEIKLGQEEAARLLVDKMLEKETEHPFELRSAKCRSVEITGEIGHGDYYYDPNNMMIKGFDRYYRAVATTDNGDRIHILLRGDREAKPAKEELLRSAVQKMLTDDKDIPGRLRSVRCRSVETGESIEENEYFYDSMPILVGPHRYRRGVASLANGEKLKILIAEGWRVEVKMDFVERIRFAVDKILAQNTNIPGRLRFATCRNVNITGDTDAETYYSATMSEKEFRAEIERIKRWDRLLGITYYRSAVATLKNGVVLDVLIKHRHRSSDIDICIIRP